MRVLFWNESMNMVDSDVKEQYIHTEHRDLSSQSPVV